MTTQVLDSAWETWYRAKHRERYSFSSGEQFEQYVTKVFELEYPDFCNPDPAGRSGDGGCDGLANSGELFFACYGQRARTEQDVKTRNKLENDFDRALKCWGSFFTWTFITNAVFGPESSKKLIELQRSHGSDSSRPLTIRVIHSEEQFWREHVSVLGINKLDKLFPGAPHAQSAALDDMVELLYQLEASAKDYSECRNLSPVSDKKMDFNRLPTSIVVELNEGRILSTRIDRWFDSQDDPELRDRKASAFHAIYEEARKDTFIPFEIMHRIYTAIGGSDFALNAKRANSVYAIASYFFDTCDIFERVPQGGTQ